MILSVIIPCYNHGKYLQEAIDSVLTYTDQPVEIIIVDDGSTDNFTVEKMIELRKQGFHVIQQPNSGLAKARNAGIAAAKGKYILPLDADNKIKADYIRKALPLLDSNQCDIVYARPDFFGDDISYRKFETKSFDGTDLLFGNYIDACSIFKKEIWSQNNGYDENMPFAGLEDWDFWISSYFNNCKFEFINEPLFEYRILENSMIVEIFQDDKYLNCQKYLVNKYFPLFIKEMEKLRQDSKFYNNDLNNPLRSIFKYIKRFINA
ncbi:glycosyltransferase family 2 protein [Pedobacter sp. CFBP9032]|uniref:glycosyltransferase family 2 protein n=1 Tax=Pedobacter sp. CFBP9032 TaxID=3096539 RepID=UPI002A6A1940|nr:glycosyltransferase family 2 protein [Pedobacter sp. CFBP9032]MDY0907442.1 glycosyltransferase family 2 protein [Pedobacter sp. CFBP9032]